jgi:GNAT superfamily N-acetyltransferase
MRTVIDAAAAVRLLETDVPRNLVTLKMAASFRECMTFVAEREGADWAILSLLPVQASDWDRRAYPEASTIVLPNGTSGTLVRRVLGAAPRGNVVFKTADPEASAFLARERGARLLTSFFSFTRAPGAEPLGADPEVVASTDFDAETWTLLGKNGYGDSELRRHLSDGARWFGVRRDGALASVCIAFPNFRDIWEIGGVYTLPEQRRKGLARRAVLRALAYLEGAGLTPRYQFRADNAASRELALSCGLSEFLRVDHLAQGTVGAERGAAIP